MRSLGIDIGSSSIKVVEVSGTSRNVQVLSFREFPIGVNPSFDRDLEVLDVLKGLALEYDPSQTRIVYALRQDFISARFKNFPFNDRLKILKSLPFELEEDLPFSSETAIYDARIVQTVGPMAEVIAVAAPKQRIEGALAPLQDSGLEPSILSAEALAFANCFERWQEPPRAISLPPDLGGDEVGRVLTARIHIGHTHSLVLAFENDRLLGARSILWGAKNVIDAISRRYEIPSIEAEKEMRTKAFILLNKAGASYDQILFSDTISGQVKDLGHELKISLLEFQSELDGEFAAAEVTGSFSLALNVHAYLTQLLEIPVNRCHFLANFNTSFEKSASTEASIGIALGLALEGLRKPKNPAIQFLRQDFAKQNEGFKEFWKNWGPAVRFGAAAFVLLFIYTSLRQSFSVELVDHASQTLKKQAQEVAGLNPRQANEAGVKNYIRTQKARAAEAKSLESVMGMNTAMDVLKRVSDVTPGKNSVQLSIRKFQVVDDKVTLEGVVKQVGQIQTLENALRGVARGPVRAQTGAALPGQAGIQFTLQFDVDRNLTATR